jgi:hypothetical protein
MSRTGSVSASASATRTAAAAALGPVDVGAIMASVLGVAAWL